MPYRSCGTIRCRIHSEGKAYLFFSPDSSYYNEHSGKKYAAFFSDKGKRFMKRIPDNGKIRIKIEQDDQHFIQPAVDAARSGIKVEIAVNKKAKKLREFTIPTK